MKVSIILKKQTLAYIVGPLFKMIEAFFDLMIPLFMKAVIDLSFNTTSDIITRSIADFLKLFGTWFTDERINYAIIGGTLILLMGIIGFMTTMVCQYIAARAASKVGTDLRDTIYEKIITLSKKDLEKFSLNKALTILNADSYQVQQGVLFFIRLGIRAPFIILGSLVISFILDYHIGLVFLSIVPLILFIIFFVMKRASKEYLSIQSQLDYLSNLTSDNLEGTRVIKAFDKQAYECEKFDRGSKEYASKAIRVNKINSLINPLTFSIVTLATILTVLIGGFDMKNGFVVLGEVVLPSTIITLTSYLTQIFQTLILLTNLVTIFTKSIVSWKRCDSLLEIESSIYDTKKLVIPNFNLGDEILRFDHVFVNYGTKEQNSALKDISFSLNKGETLGIIGGTGSGKTTLVRLICRFLDSSEGTVYYKNNDIKDYSLYNLREEIAYNVQKASLFKGTIRFNMQIANSAVTDEDIIKALKIAKADFVFDYPDKLDHNVEENGKNFSGGQRQRLAIARSLLKNSEILILDDSTSALDLLTDRTVRENIKINYPDLTKVIISQRVSTIMQAEKILVMQEGKIIASGKHDELIKSCPIYKDTYLSQQGGRYEC